MSERRPHPALGRCSLSGDGRDWPVRRVWPAALPDRDGVLAAELVAPDGSAIGAWVDDEGRLDVLAADPALPSLEAFRARADAEVLAHRPSKRAVVRLVAADGARRYVKLASPRSAGRAVSKLAMVTAELRGRRGAPLLGGVEHHDVASGAITFTELAGRPLAGAVVAGRRAAGRAAAHAAASIAAIAAADGAGLPEHTVADEVEVLRRWVDQAIACGAVVGDRAVRLRRRCELAAELLSKLEPYALVLTHRDLHDGQILLGRGGSVGVLDWDTASRAPAALDIGNLLAHLDRLGPLGAAAAATLVDVSRRARHPAWSEGSIAVAAWREVAAVRLEAVHAFRPPGRLLPTEA